MKLFWWPALVAVALIVAACGEVVELQRIASPSGNIVATLTRDSGSGAMDPYTYDVRLSQGRARIDVVTLRWVKGIEGRPIIELKWRDDATLLIEFLEASEIIGHKEQARLGDRTISVILLGKKSND